MNDAPRIAIILGSDSDFPAFQNSLDVLKEFKVSYELLIASAHHQALQ